MRLERKFQIVRAPRKSKLASKSTSLIKTGGGESTSTGSDLPDKMPRTSLKRKVINRVDALLVSARKHAAVKLLCGLSFGREEEMIHRLRMARIRFQNERYLFRRGTYRKKESKFRIYLETDIEDALNDREFKYHFRVSRDCFWQLVDLIKAHPNFHRASSDSRGRNPKPAAHQLLILLKYLGTDGNAASSMSLGEFFGVGNGAIDECRKNALEAILTLEDRTYFWPRVDERKAIANRIKKYYFFPQCVGIIDGTLLPLASRPWIHGETYLSRKRFYAIAMLVVCDDKGRILFYHVGWPGSVHDNRVWRNCRLYHNCNEMFSPGEYLLGDSAFTASHVMIPPFKSLPGRGLDANKTAFNTLLAKPRVKSEHCIGVLKGRFPFMRHIRLRLRGKSDMKRIIKHVRCAVVLHNFLIEDDIEDDWIESEEDDNQESETIGIEMTSNTADCTRRNEIYFFLSELQETAIN